MKFSIILIIFCTGCFYANAQTLSQSFSNLPVILQGPTPNETIQLGGGNYFQKVNLENNNNLGLPGYTPNEDVDNDSYFTKDWVAGSITTKDNNTYTSDLLFMYDKIKRILYFRKVDSATIYEADINNIVTFTLVTDKAHIFVRSDYFNGADRNNFFEILLLNDKKYSLFKLLQREYQHNNENVGAMAMTQSSESGNYKDIKTYYLYQKNNLKIIPLKKKDFIKALNDDQQKAEDYVTKHSGSFDEAYAVNLLSEINQ